MLTFVKKSKIASFGGFVLRKCSTSTIDKQEIEHFDQLSSDWWNESGQLKALHSMNRIRVPWIKDVLLSTRAKDVKNSLNVPLSGLSILDVGCGAGILCEPLARLGASVTGIDAAAENVDAAKKHWEQVEAKFASKDRHKPSLNYSATSIEEFQTKSPAIQFDAVVASEVLEHVANFDEFLKICVDMLKPEGFLFVTTLNKTLMSKVLAIYVAENLLNIVPRGIHDWDKFVEPQDVQFLLERQNCTVRMVSGLCYNPLTNYWRWIRDTSVNYGLHAQKNS